MFLRIDNDHSIVWNADYMGEGDWCLEQVPPELQRKRGVTTPVVLNPCLQRVRDPPWSAFDVFFYGGEELTLSFCHTSTLQHFERQSISQGFFSDPQCGTIQVKLAFALGSTGFVSVHAKINSEVPLTIQAMIPRTMDTLCEIYVNGAYCSRLPSGWAVKKGVPGDFIEELQH
jgi:hypothetical protein